MGEAIEISSRLREMIDRSNVQCRSLAALPEGLFDLFLSGRREAVVVLRGRPVRAGIRVGIDDEVFEIEAPDLVPFLRTGSVLLVVFPGDSRRYVVQARVVALFADGFRVECLDPRYSERLIPESEVVVSWRRVPDEVELAVRNGTLRVFRSLDDGGVVERVAPEEDDTGAPPGFEAAREFAVLADISAGGAALFSRTRVDGGLAGHLVYMETGDPAPLRAGLFAMARGVSDRNGGSVIHLMFVARIPEETAAGIAGRKEAAE